MSKLCNIVISVLFTLVLIGPAAVVACEVGGVALPSWASAEDAKWLSGSGGGSDLMANLSLDGFSSGELQDALDRVIGNCVPFRARAMLDYAATQRGLIAMAGFPFGWECYPTYYGSSRLFIPSQRAVTYLPLQQNSEDLQALRDFGHGIAQVAGAHPEKRFAVCMVQGFQSPAVNPAYDLVSDPLLPDDQLKALEDGIGGCANVVLLSLGYDNLDDYYRDYFRTDHHWNWRGASRAYNELASALGLDEFVSPGEVSLEPYEYMGATARWGLVDISEEVCDTTFDFSVLEVATPGQESYRYNHSRFYDLDGPGKVHQFHDAYYDIMPSGTIVTGPGQGSALVLADSYGASISPYIFTSYAHSSFHEDVRASGASAPTMAQLVSQTDCDDVFVIASPNDMCDILRANPGYFQ